MPDIQWQITASENVSAAVQRIGQALGGLDSMSTRAAGGLAAALGQTQTAATATAGAVQRLGAQPLRLTDQATPLLTQLRAELNRLAGPPPVVLTARDGITPLLAPLTTRLDHLPAPPAIPITARDDVAAVLQRITSEVQRLNITVPPIRIPAVAAPAPAAQQAAAADPAGTQRLAQQAAAAQGAVQSLGTRLDTLQRQLAGIGQTRPSITLTSNYQALQAEIATLQSRLTALSKQPYSVQVKTETAQVRADLAGLQRQFAGFKAELPPLAPKVDSGPVESALRRMQQGFQETGRAAQQHSGAVSSFFSNALSAATGFLAANVFSRITSGFGDLIGGVVGASASMEQTRAGFTSLLGSAQAADTLIKQLQQEANVSPFELESFRKASQLLLGMGVAAQEIVPRLHEVSNVVAAVGGGTEQFDRITLALAQIQAKGKLSAQEVNQLAENGVPAWDLLAKAMGKSTAEVQKLSEAGKISADTFNQAFAAFANSDQISQAAERNSHTFNGLLSTISDIGKALATAFGTPVLTAVEPVLEQIVNSLKDPAVLTTLGQWGAAAGQFAVGLIQAGQTAFTVASQIIQALQPVTDFIGQLFGISGQAAPTIKPPDFTPAAQSASLFGANIKAGADNTKGATDQVAALERQTRDLARATAEANVGYDHRKQSLQDQLTLLDRQYQAENKAADVQSLQEKIAKDRVLAVNQYSSQGQAAASRLVDEEARLKALQREQGHDAAKQGIEDRIKAVDREKQATDEASAARTRALQEQMDALRANAAATTALTNAINRPPSTAGTTEFKRQQAAVQAVADHVTDLGRKLGLLPASIQGQPKSMLDRLLGTQAEQIAAANAAANNMITGFFAGIKGKATFGEFMQTMFGGASPFAAPEQWGADAARAVRQGLGLDTGKPGGEGKGPQSNETKAAADPANYTANPFDPSSYNPFDALGKALTRTSAQIAAGAGAGATRPPDAMPLISGQNAQAQANTLTAQWRAKGFKGQYVFDRGHLVWVPEPGAARAEGGPVYAGQSYTVGERGPETLVMGTTSGRIVPNGGVQEHVFRFEFDNNGLARVIDKRTGQVLQDALR